MSIEKIGNVDQNAVNVHQRPDVHKHVKKQAGEDVFVHEPAATGDAIKVKYPPFLPFGDTQSILKK